MSINGMGGEFGFNVKKYQQMSRTQFGQMLAAKNGGTSGVSAGKFQLDDSIFKMGTQSANPFGSKQARMERQKGYDADAIAMLNKMQGQQNTQQTQSQQTEKSPSWKEVGQSWKEAFKAYDDAFGKGSKTEDKSKAESGTKPEAESGAKPEAKPAQNSAKPAASTGTENSKSSSAVNDIENAEDKETLNSAIDGAKEDKKGVEAKGKEVDGELKTSDAAVEQTGQEAASTEEVLNQATEGLKQNEQNLEQAKADVQTCTDNYSAAQTKTAGCKQAVADAKAAATEDNPNTAAIKKAEADLKAAEAEEEKAKQALDSAKQKETEAQEAVDKSKEEVQTATAENEKAQEAAKAAQTENTELKATQTEIKQESAELDTGIADGEARLEQMVNEEPNSYGEIPGDINGQNQMMETEGYTEAQKEQVNLSRQSVQDMQPGDTVNIGGWDYTMDENGVIHSPNGDGTEIVFESKDDAVNFAGVDSMANIEEQQWVDGELEYITNLYGDDKAGLENDVYYQTLNEYKQDVTGTNFSTGEDLNSVSGTESDLQSIREEKARIAEEYANNPAYADAKLEEDPYYTQLNMQEATLSGSDSTESTGGTESDLQSIREEKARIAEEYANNPAYADAKLEEDPYYTQLSMQEATLSGSGSTESTGGTGSMFDTQTDLINNGNYSADEKQQMFEARDQIMSMEPGDMIMVGDMTYEMDAEGNITQRDSGGNVVGEYQGDEYGFGKESAAMNAADQFKDKFDARNQSDLEMQALRSGSENDEEKIKKAKKKGDAR